jgi:light-regulated signal transduction histidine kinase (bacteriophytochrome)
VAGIFAAARDVGALRQAEREIRALNANLERRVDERTRELAVANRELQQFIYSVSHDLRTPLRAVDGFSHTVLEDYGEVLGEQGRGDLRRVRNAAQRMGELIDALLSLSRVRSGRVALGEVDLSALARRAAADLMSGDPERAVQLKVGDGLVVEADEALLAIVVENLLSNAWKFTAGESEARIEVGVEKREGRPVFFVRDNGCGFAPAYANKLFTPFQRLHAADEYPGTGIGLATVARVLERMGGSYWAEARPGEGAAFFFTLAGGHESTGPGSAATAETR